MQKIATAGENLKSAGDKVSSTGEKLLPASAAVTALGVAAVKTASDFDSSMSQVAAVSGATGEDFDKLRAKAREMGAKTKFSASEAAYTWLRSPDPAAFDPTAKIIANAAQALRATKLCTRAFPFFFFWALLLQVVTCCKLLFNFIFFFPCTSVMF